MFGFLFGAAAVATLFYVKQRRRGWARHGGCHGGSYSGGGPWGRAHWGRRGHWGGEGHDDWGAPHGGSSPFWLRGVFARLDTTPGQEKVIREVFDEMRAHGRDLGAEFGRARTDVADALRADTIDATALGEAFGRHDDALDRMRKAAIGALAKLHDALDERQRRLLAQWIESRRGGGPYRDAPGFA
jgi:uncharacterized membrane protein